MKRMWVVLCGCLFFAGCVRQDPVARAAIDLRRAAEAFALQEEERKMRFSSLKLGMSDKEVLNVLGPPDARNASETPDTEQREVWTYRTAFRPLGTLTFDNGRLTDIRME